MSLLKRALNPRTQVRNKENYPTCLKILMPKCASLLQIENDCKNLTSSACQNCCCTITTAILTGRRCSIYAILFDAWSLAVAHSDLQVIWMTTPPISVDIRSGLLIRETQFQRHSMRFNIMEANQCAASIVAGHGFDVLGR